MSRNGGMRGAVKICYIRSTSLGWSHSPFDDHETFALNRRPDAVEDEAIALPTHMDGTKPYRGSCNNASMIASSAPPSRHQLDRRQLRPLVIGVWHARSGASRCR
jgi:hypothetical protein